MFGRGYSDSPKARNPCPGPPIERLQGRQQRAGASGEVAGGFANGSWGSYLGGRAWKSPGRMRPIRALRCRRKISTAAHAREPGPKEPRRSRPAHHARRDWDECRGGVRNRLAALLRGLQPQQSSCSSTIGSRYDFVTKFGERSQRGWICDAFNQAEVAVSHNTDEIERCGQWTGRRHCGGESSSDMDGRIDNSTGERSDDVLE